MQLELSAEQVSALMSLMPAEATGRDSGFAYADGHLTVPDAWRAEVTGILSNPGWEASTSRDALLRYAARRRWEVETGGITIGGVPIATDDRSKIMIMGARVAAQANPDWTTIWHGSDGGAYPLDAAAMVAISDAVEVHVNATFAAFAAVKADVEAGVVKTIEQVDRALG